MSDSLVAGRYRLDERIGGDADGQVWRGYDLRADWTVAVTMLARAGDGLAERVRAVAKVVHPNVAMVLDVGDAEGKPFLVVEFLTGESLGEELASGGPLPIVEACDLIGQAAAGLDAAHREGVVHGRVDLETFRRAGSGVLKVVGFALEDPGLEAADDLRALGRVAYQALTARPPADAPASLRELRPEIPEQLDRLVLALIAGQTADYPNGETVRRALAAIARPKPASTGHPAAVPSTGDSMAAPAAGSATHLDGGAQTATGGMRHTQIMPGEPFPRPGDTAVYDQPVPPSSNKKLFIQLGAAVAVIAVVTVAMIVWANSGSTPPVALPTPTVASSSTPSPTPTPTRTPTPSATLGVDTEQPSIVETGGPPKGSLKDTPPGGWQHFLSQLDSAVASEGENINPAVAREVHKKIQKAGEKFRRGQEEQGRKQLESLGRDIAKAMSNHDIPTSGPLVSFLNDWPLTSSVEGN
ncbi:serine/threonine protein kinase [Nonomuraea sp. NPDC050536]|uniref:serine/threonine protein kinase n=1 Tax=Nonomuraea sp. NPDC050536 TaxID=3364366 RepID=UPI0037C98F12